MRFVCVMRWTICICGTKFDVDHALICRTGGFTIQRHNELRDLTASVLTDVCHNVSTEPPPQPLGGELSARGFWNRGQDAFFDVRVFNPNASSYRIQDISNLFSKHESEKKREYNQRVLEVENNVFTPLVFSTSGGMSKECTVFYKRLVNLPSKKKNEPYSVIMGWLRCRLNFALLRSSILCVRGSRSSKQHPIPELGNITLKAGYHLSQMVTTEFEFITVLSLYNYYIVYIFSNFHFYCLTDYRCIKKK